MTVQSISAVTLAVKDMGRSVDFYQNYVGLTLLHGGETASFSSFAVGDGYINLDLRLEKEWGPWGRVILYVDDVDAQYQKFVNSGWGPSTAPRDATWGERFFHINDPDGHELSFARPLPGPQQPATATPDGS